MKAGAFGGAVTEAVHGGCLERLVGSFFSMGLGLEGGTFVIRAGRPTSTAYATMANGPISFSPFLFSIERSTYGGGA